jgi:hypothetical protein
VFPCWGRSHRGRPCSLFEPLRTSPGLPWRREPCLGTDTSFVRLPRPVPSSCDESKPARSLMAAGLGCECTHPEFAAKRPSFNLWLVTAYRNEHTCRELSATVSFLTGTQLGKCPANSLPRPRGGAHLGSSLPVGHPREAPAPSRLPSTWSSGNWVVGIRRTWETGTSGSQETRPHSLRTDPLPWSSWRRARVAG